MKRHESTASSFAAREAVKSYDATDESDIIQPPLPPSLPPQQQQQQQQNGDRPRTASSAFVVPPILRPKFKSSYSFGAGMPGSLSCVSDVAMLNRNGSYHEVRESLSSEQPSPRSIGDRSFTITSPTSNSKSTTIASVADSGVVMTTDSSSPLAGLIPHVALRRNISFNNEDSIVDHESHIADHLASISRGVHTVLPDGFCSASSRRSLVACDTTIIDNTTTVFDSPTSPPSSSLSLPNAVVVDKRALHFVVVDDNAINRIILMKMLNTVFHCKVKCHSSAMEVFPSLITYVDTSTVRVVVLTDVHMPGMNGIELTQQLRKTWNEAALPIIGAWRKKERK
jgi:CheY-like chemotaxis protein